MSSLYLSDRNTGNCTVVLLKLVLISGTTFSGSRLVSDSKVIFTGSGLSVRLKIFDSDQSRLSQQFNNTITTNLSSCYNFSLLVTPKNDTLPLIPNSFIFYML